MIVDTGLHYKGMKRSEAFKMFAEYAWDDSDFTQKEVYISVYSAKIVITTTTTTTTTRI